MSRLNNLVKNLSKERVSFAYSIILACALIFSFFIGISCINILPTLYFFIMKHVKTYLEEEAQHRLQIIIYDDYWQYWFLINISIIGAGIFLYILFDNKNSLRSLFIRISSLLWTINLRIAVRLAILFLIVVGIIGAYFGYKLFILTKGIGLKSPVVFKPFKFLFKVTGTYSSAKELWQQTQILAGARIIFDHINRTSYYMYWITQIISTLAACWTVLTLQEKMRTIQKQ